MHPKLPMNHVQTAVAGPPSTIGVLNVEAIVAAILSLSSAYNSSYNSGMQVGSIPKDADGKAQSREICELFL